MALNLPPHLVGLTDKEVEVAQQLHGRNQINTFQKSTWLKLLLDIVKEPMLILLIIISIIYFVVGDYAEAVFMFIAIVAVSAISFYQDNRSQKALEALEQLNEPLSRVIRNGKEVSIATHDLVVGDLCIIEEGQMINADGRIVYSSDFSVNESSLTGETYSVFKNAEAEHSKIYSGTLVVSGLAVFEVEYIGTSTQLGKIGQSIQGITEEQSPLHQQITRFVKGMALIGLFVFLLVWGYSYWQSRDVMDSLLVGLTLAMSILPEEIPVAFTTFMAMGSWKLMKQGIIVKKSSVVETLGSTTVICTDKTGTITENTMELHGLYDFKTKVVYASDQFGNETLAELITYAMWSSEPVPFDPMEKTIHQVYEQFIPIDHRNDYHMIHEYPLEGKPPMMTHLFENDAHHRIIAAKGAPEALLAVSNLTEEEKKELRAQIKTLGQQGYRLLGVGKSNFEGNQFPAQQQEFTFEFLGFTIFYDPPKKGIQDVFHQIYDAGIKVKVITGDNEDTTLAIATQAGIHNTSPAVNGADLVHSSDQENQVIARQTTLFTRMFPEAKLKMVNALKSDGEVVAMLGDGVNDAPALKAAHIGVAMGTKGTEIAKAAAALVLVDDDLNKLVIGIAAGRRIYTNIKKAVQYIISIHIPIILTVSLPLFLGWIYPHIFTPVHVIFLELIMGPICSIVYENEPLEKGTMEQPPRKITDTFLNWKELSISIVQGLVIAGGVLFAYQYTVSQGGDEWTTRAMVFSTLIFANVFLSLANRSFTYSIWETLTFKNRLFPLVIGLSLVLLLVILYVPLVAEFFKVSALNLGQLGISIGIAALTISWFEVYKWMKRSKA